MKHFLLSISVLALSGFAFAATAAAPPVGPMPVWSASSSTVLNPSQNTAKDAWESEKGHNPKPSVDQHLSDPVLKGAIDVHAHFGPDTYNRQWDAFEIVKRAQERGMRGVVLKNHWSESAGLAYLARKYAAPGLEVFGGLVLNAPEGGINPQAVRYFAEVEGHFGKVVWMPTHDSEHEVTYLRESRPFVRVSKDGVLLPEVLQVLDLIAEYHLTLATGHISTNEMLLIMREAKKRGIDRIIITHPDLGPQYTDPDIDQIKQAVALGGYAEVVANEFNKPNSAQILNMIRTLGPSHIIISTDSGMMGTPNHADRLVLTARLLRKEGFSEADLDLMFKQNPAKVLGLSVQ